jgi:hypothetical protein
MAFALADAALPVDEDVQAELRREWERLAAPGTWFSGAERVAIATEARAARTLGAGDTGLAEPVVEVAQAASAAAQYVTRAWVEDLLDHGMTIEQYVEIVGVVGRLAAVDAYVRGVGASEEPLPAPQRGQPTQERNDAVQLRNAFVPTENGDRAPFALSAVPAEAEALLSLHGPLYLTVEQMKDPAFEGALTRAQMELVAARTSYLNDCMY